MALICACSSSGLLTGVGWPGIKPRSRGRAAGCLIDVYDDVHSALMLDKGSCSMKASPAICSTLMLVEVPGRYDVFMMCLRAD